MQAVCRILVLAACVATIAEARADDESGYGPKVGEHHPEFTLPDVNSGTPVSLSDFRGKKVLLIQFASW